MLLRQRFEWKVILVLVITLLIFIWYMNKKEDWKANFNQLEKELSLKMKLISPQIVQTYNNSVPLIFIGGVPRSGTTLMRAMLDAHPEIRCGEETRIIPRVVSLRYELKNPNNKEKERLEEAGVTSDVIDSAIGAFILDIIVKHGEPSSNLCNKDPLMLSHTTFLKSIFPNSRFILMVRDARATIHSIISRKITISGFNLNSYRDCFERWNMIIETMYNQCQEVGSKSCLIVKYEQLVIHPEENLRKIFEFLNITWNEAVLHHEKFIGDEVSLSKTEKSTDQVIKPVNLDALSNWVGHIPRDVLAEIDTIAPMLKRLGYDTMASVPNYGMSYTETTENAFNVHKNKDYWINLALNNTFYRS